MNGRARGGVRWEGGAKAASDRGTAVRGDLAVERAGHPRDKIDIKYKLVHEYSSCVVPNGSGFLVKVLTAARYRATIEIWRARTLQGLGKVSPNLLPFRISSAHLAD